MTIFERELTQKRKGLIRQLASGKNLNFLSGQLVIIEEMLEICKAGKVKGAKQ